MMHLKIPLLDISVFDYSVCVDCVYCMHVCVVCLCVCVQVYIQEDNMKQNKSLHHSLHCSLEFKKLIYEGWIEGNVLFNDALNTFLFMVKWPFVIW